MCGGGERQLPSWINLEVLAQDVELLHFFKVMICPLSPGLRFSFEEPLPEEAKTPLPALPRPRGVCSGLCPPVLVTAVRGNGEGCLFSCSTVNYSIDKLPHSSVPKGGVKLGACGKK